MKHIFILNPSAGNGSGVEKLKNALEKLSCDYKIHETTAHLEATEFVRNYCETHSDELRFYACGGDGTLKEVAEGVLGFSNASISVYPIGSGNDFVKYFGGAEKFFDLEKLISAKTVPIDMIHIKTNEGVDTYAINAINFGFEACAAAVMNKVRRKPIIGGANSYTTGVVGAIFKAMKNRGNIYADGELITPEGAYILCTAANGGYIGGGYHCAPRASVDDGFLEVCKFKTISIFTLVRLIGTYKSGGHLDDPRFKKYITYRRAKKVESISEKPLPLSLDGEVMETKHFTAEIVEKAVRFAAP
ncbi:MAG: hypothetical protein IJC81_00130 [Clostridia bacterium]|nr:hypothetical protein [Clostridia bacterium]